MVGQGTKLTIVNLWVAIVAEGSRGNRLNNSMFLVVHFNGDDKIFHTFEHIPRHDLSQQQTNIYPINLETPLTIEDFSSDELYFRVGVNGGDMWKPSKFFIWGQTSRGDAVPMAYQSRVSEPLSTSVGDVDFSIAIPRVNQPDAGLHATRGLTFSRLMVLMITSNAHDIGTYNRISMSIYPWASNDTFECVLDQTSQGTYNPDQASLYEFTTGNYFFYSSVGEENVTLLTDGENDWRPKSFWLFGYDWSRNEFTPIINIPDWDIIDISRDRCDGRSIFRLPIDTQKY